MLLPFFYLVNEFMCQCKKIVRQDFEQEIEKYLVSWLETINANTDDYFLLEILDITIKGWNRGHFFNHISIFKMRTVYFQRVSACFTDV